MSYETDSLGKRIAKCLLSAFIAALFGVVVAEVVANSLVEISITPVFSVVFGAAFVLLGVSLVYRAFTSLNESSKRGFMIFFALLVFASGLFSFLLQKEWVHMESKPKSIMYAVVGLSLAFSLSFSFTEFINMGLCDKCCSTDFENNPIISTKSQIILIFVGTTLMGALHGLMFGLIDVENDDERHDKFTENLLWSLPLGATVGAVIGFLNQWIRSTPESSGYAQWSTKTPIIHSDMNDDI